MYSLAEAMAPFGAELKYYLIQTRPRRDDTVSICAVLCFRHTTDPLIVAAACDDAIESMAMQMEQDLRQHSIEMGVNCRYWRYQVEVNYDNP